MKHVRLGALAALAAAGCLAGPPAAGSDPGYPEAQILRVDVSFPTGGAGPDFCASDTKCPSGVYTQLTVNCTFPGDGSGIYRDPATGHYWEEQSVAVGYWEDVQGGYLTKTIVEHGQGCRLFTPFLYGSSMRDCHHTDYAYTVSMVDIANGRLSWSPAYHFPLPKLDCNGGGGGVTTTTTGGGGGATGPTLAATFSAPVDIKHADGTYAHGEPAVIKPFDQFTSGGAAVKITIRGTRTLQGDAPTSGTIVLDKHTRLDYTPADTASGPVTWTMKHGNAYFAMAAATTVWDGFWVAVGRGPFTWQGASGIRSYAGDVAVTEHNGDGSIMGSVTIHAGQWTDWRLVVRRSTPSAHPFWK